MSQPESALGPHGFCLCSQEVHRIWLPSTLSDLSDLSPRLPRSRHMYLLVVP